MADPMLTTSAPKTPRPHVETTSRYSACVTVPADRIHVFPGSSYNDKSVTVDATSNESTEAAVAALRAFAFEILKAVTPDDTQWGPVDASGVGGKETPGVTP